MGSRSLRFVGSRSFNSRASSLMIGSRYVGAGARDAGGHRRHQHDRGGPGRRASIDMIASVSRLFVVERTLERPHESRRERP
jgi:hypothetical protein